MSVIAASVDVPEEIAQRVEFLVRAGAAAAARLGAAASFVVEDGAILCGPQGQIAAFLAGNEFAREAEIVAKHEPSLGIVVAVALRGGSAVVSVVSPERGGAAS